MRPGGKMSNARLAELVSALESELLDFMERHQVNHDEYRAATDLIVSSIKQGEESLLFDVFFEARATDTGNVDREGSPEAIEGPFYVPNAPFLPAPSVMPQRPNEAGVILFFTGEVRDAKGNPISEMEIDLWHADAEGLYSNIHPGIPDFNLRGRFNTDSDGKFEVKTILPPPYEIPKSGPTGYVLSQLGRHFFRPAHLHMKLRHPNHVEMTSQLYFAGGDYLKNDVANAVREGLIGVFSYVDDPAEIARRGLSDPFYVYRYDFTLPS
ncbi:catechol 1,2-dioxygenase [Pseudomonas moorei]|nr:catechol 1,2-dioxygenase [Pseudomonas moorei]